MAVSGLMTTWPVTGPITWFSALWAAGPVALGRIGPFTVYLFGLTVAAGCVVGLIAAVVQARRFGISGARLFEVSAPALLLGMVGARAAYVLVNFADYRPALAAVVHFAEGGFSFYGGLAVGAVAGAWYAHRLGLPVGRMLDAVAPGLAVGQAVGFIGAHLGGRPGTAPWAVVVDGQSVHPFPAYAIVFAYALFFVVWRLSARPSSVRPGRLFLLYLLMHGLGTSIVWTWSAGARYLGLTANQWSGLAVAVVSLVILATMRDRHTIFDAERPRGAASAVSAAVVAVATRRRRWDRPESARLQRIARAAGWLGGLAALLVLFSARL